MEKIKLAIIGVGLIGGSLGLCLKDKLGDDIFITGLCRTTKSMALAAELGAVDLATNNAEKVVGDADIIFLSTPVLQIVPMVQEILPYLKKGAIITDAGSTKEYLRNELKKILPDDVFYVAGHPMTGREKSGVAAAKKDLFVGKAYVIVHDDSIPPEVCEKLLQVLRLTGANFLTLPSATLHDKCASTISHVPHIAAAALVSLLTDSGEQMDSCLKLIGGGFRDTTRIASSNADMWADICMTNKNAIVFDIKRLQKILGDVAEAIEQGDRTAVHDYFAAAKKCRDGILERTTKIFDVN